VAVKANQEMILRLVWMNEATRHKTMLELFSFSKEQIPQKDYPPSESAAVAVAVARHHRCARA
jgi:hypothetical protein